MIQIYHPEIGQKEQIMKIYTKESLINELNNIRNKGWIRSTRHGNAGGVGNTLEDLLGIKENNLPIPNANEWELKCQRANTTSLITLFHMEPSPTACKLVSSLLLPKYGWQHPQAGKRYNANEKSFRQTISGKTRSDRGFMVKVDRANSKVVISFDATAVAPHHADWLRSVCARVGNLAELEPQPYWGFNDLKNKAGTKLLNCFFIQAEVKKEAGVEYFKYSQIKILEGFNMENFLQGITAGYVFVDFDARTGHNHGTKFRIQPDKLPTLYTNVKDI